MRNGSAFPITETELKLITAAAIMGLSDNPNAGNSTSCGCRSAEQVINVPSYNHNEGMRRLFQFGAVIMLIGAFIPLLELFDRWDAPGLSNDTEYAVYALVFAICLVLLVCKLISSGALKIGFISCRVFLRDDRVKPVEAGHIFFFTIPPLFILPLRI